MSMKAKTVSAIVAAVAACCGLLATQAAESASQNPAPMTPPSATTSSPAIAAGEEAPERTTSQFGDWAVTCTGETGKPNRACEMTTTVRSQNHQASATFAIGRAAHGRPLRMVVRVPVNVQVTQPANLNIDGLAPVALPFLSCNALGCFAELELTNDDLLSKLRARPADQAGHVVWHLGAGTEANFPVSFRGFPAALDALGKSS